MMSDNKLLADYTFSAKYAKFNADKLRRETYEEAVDRMVDMHLRRFPEQDYPRVSTIIEATRQPLRDKKVVGSQRAMQFGGDAILEKNMRINNCSALHMNYPESFKHVHWLLLCGTGVGFSVQQHHVAELPTIIVPKYERKHVVSDSIEGWADATHALFTAFFTGGDLPNFDFSEVRPKGAKLRFGGKAPGPQPLVTALARCKEVLLGAAGRKLRPIEVFDCAMHLADSVVSGGIRRSACITLFDVDDAEMLTAKTGDWFVKNAQRGRANISAVITPDTPRDTFLSIFANTKQFGEPGFVFLNSKEFVLNPCAEVVMCPTLITAPNGEIVEHYTLDMLAYENRAAYRAKGYKFESGVQVCNLSEVNLAKMESADDFIDGCIAAAVLGTLQAAYTVFGYLGSVSEQIVRREALIGVSLTGTFSNKLCEDAALLKEAATVVVATNRRVSNLLYIKPSSRCTLVKPSGTASIVLETSAGVHPWHAPKYIRRVQADAYEDLYKFVESKQPERCYKSAWGGEHARFIAFACEAPQGATVKSNINALQHLDYVKHINVDWVRPGNALPARLEGADHNVSCTINVREDEWDAVASYLFENKAFFTGVSLLGASGDYDYVQAPYQEVYSEVDDADPKRGEKLEMAALHDLLSKLPALDLSECMELEDTTELLGAVACAGGQCDITFTMPKQPETQEQPEPQEQSKPQEDLTAEFNQTQAAAVALLLDIAAPLLRDVPHIYFQVEKLLKPLVQKC